MNVIFPRAFHVMAQEGHLMVASLLNGFDLLHKSTFDRLGSFYSALFHLSTGLERLMKIVVILEHKVKNDLENPTDKHLRSFGHSIIDCYATCKAIAIERNQSLERWFRCGDSEYDVLTFLSDFATGNRYYNLNQLVGGKRTSDPLAEWCQVQTMLVQIYLSPKMREAIMQSARVHCETFGLYGWELGPCGEYQLTIDLTYQLETFRRTRGHCVWTIIKILRPFYDLLEFLCDEVHRIETLKGFDEPTVPYMTEFVPFFLCNQKTSIRRKTWLATYAS